MAPSASSRLPILIWSTILLISLLATVAGSTSVNETHITTTQITVSEHHGLHVTASSLKVPEVNPPDLDLNKRTAQPDISTPANPSMLFLVGTHLVTFTAGEVKNIDGTSFSLDKQTRTLYATGSPYYVPDGLAASTSSLSLGGGNATLAAGQGIAVDLSTASSSTLSSTRTVSSGSTSESSAASMDVSTEQVSGSMMSDTSTGASTGSSSQRSSSHTQATSTILGTGATQSTGERSATSTTGSSSSSQLSVQDASSSVPQSGSSSVDTKTGSTLTSASSVGQSFGTNHSTTTAATSASIDHSGISTHASVTSGLSAASNSSALSSSTSRATGVTGTESTSRNTSAVSIPTVSSGPASDTLVATSVSAHNTSGSITSTTRSSLNTTLSGTSKTSSASFGANSPSASSETSSPLITGNGSEHASSTMTAQTNSSQPHVSASLSLTTSPGGSSSHGNTTAGVTSSASSRSGNETTSTVLESSTRANGTSTTTILGTSKSRSGVEVVTTFVSTITAINVSDASGSQTSTKVVTTVVSTISGLSKGSTDASSSVKFTTSDDSTMSTSSTDDASTLITPLPLSSTTSGEALQEVTLMTGHWDESVMQMSCAPPCTMTLPPIPLNTPATLRYPPAITSVCTNVGSQIYRYVTTVSMNPVTITELALLPVSVGAMTGRQPAVTSEVDFSLPQGSCSIALPPGDVCAKRPADSNNGTCGPQVGLGCPDMQCCGPQGTCGTGSSECVIANGCNHDFGPCWLPGEESFRPLSEVFAPATDTSACPIALLPGPSDGPEIAQPPDITGSQLPPPGQTSSDGLTLPVPIPVPIQTPPPGGPPGPPGGPPSPPGLPKLPTPPNPRLCLIFCSGGVKLPKWKLDLGCRGPLCKNVGRKRGCLGICDLLKCLVGCDKKGGGRITGGDKPPPDPVDPPGPDDDDEDEPEETETASTSASRTQSSSETESECETTMTATQVTAMCNIFTEVIGINMGNDTTLSAPQTTCTSTKRRVIQGCEVTGTTTTMFESCTKKQTATEITKFCTESVSSGVTYTPCTKTASTVFEGCSVTATTTSVIDDVCQAQVTLAPDDPQGEFGSMPANASNETCPYFPGVVISVLDDQGSDGQQNDTCAMPSGTRTSFDDDQGDDEPKSSCKLGNGTTIDSSSAPSCPLSNATLIQGPDGAEDGNVTDSCPWNDTIIYEPEGALDNDTAPLCNLDTNMNITMEQELGQGEDGLKSNQSCPIGGNSTLEVDNEQGEDRQPTQESCPVIPDGIILSPLADLGDYAPTNESSCPALDGRFLISWLDEQGDDWQPDPVNATLQSEIWSAYISSLTDCSPPKSGGLGKCTLVMPNTATGKPFFSAPFMSQISMLASAEQVSSMHAGEVIASAAHVTPWSCTCAFQTQGQVVNATTKCGTPMCPNSDWQTTSTRPTEIDTAPLITYTDPTPPNALSSFASARCKCTKTTVGGRSTCIGPTTCPNSDCIYPINTYMGCCEYVPVSVLKTADSPAPKSTMNYHGLEPYPDIDYCVCTNAGTALIDAMPGCDSTARICPNQLGFVTETWPSVTSTECRATRGLPDLPWFESCGLATGTMTTTIEGVRLSSVATFCTCNKVSETGSKASSYVISTVSRQCNGIYMCHNSDGFVDGRPKSKSKAHKRIHERATTAATATAVGPLLAVTTEATPGSAPTMAAEPTILMAE